MTQDVVPVRRVETLSPPSIANEFAKLWQAGYEAEQAAWLQRWAEARHDWLANIYSQRSRSRNTTRAYNHGLDRFYMFIGADPWLVTEMHREKYRQQLARRGVGPGQYRLPWTVTGDDVAAYIVHLTEEKLSQSTIANYLAIGSSFYEHCIRAAILFNGVEISLFPDAMGRTRGNPFRAGNVNRPAVTAYGKSHPLTVVQCQQMRFHIRPDTLTGSRDMAIFMTLLYSGRRVGELVEMRWEDIRGEEGAKVWHWRGKGGKSGSQALPAPAYNAIVGYLKRHGRWVPDGKEYVFAPFSDRATRNVYDGDLVANRPISRSRVRQIVKRLARQAGLPAEIHPHTLRHTFAFLYQRAKGDINALSQILGHSSPSTTLIYTGSPAMQRPVDNYSQAFQETLGF